MTRILHISDLHVHPAVAPDVARLVKALLHDLERRSAETRFDLVVFSGDLTFGASHAEFDSALEVLILPLLKQLDIASSAFFLAKGNHDVSIVDIDRVVESGLRSTLRDSDALNSFLSSPQSASFESALDRSRNWEDFDSLLSGAAARDGLARLGSAHNVTIGETDFGIAVLDSAWRATGAPEDGDRHHLLVGERQIERVLSGIESSDLKIAVMHHPLSWLADWDARNVERDLRRAGVTILLTGHTHVNSSAAITVEGSLIQCGTGAVFQGRVPWPNSYNIVDVADDLRTVTVTARRYEEARDAFAPDTSVSDSGILVFPIGDSEQEVAISAVQDKAALDVFRPDRALETIAQAALENNPIFIESRVDLTNGYFELASDLLVPPVLLDMPHSQWVLAQRNKEAERPGRAEITGIMTGEAVPLIVGDAGSGISTTLDWLLLQLPADSVPVRMSVRELNFKSPAKFSSSIDQAFGRMYGGVPDRVPGVARVVAIEGLGDLSRQRLEDLFTLLRAGEGTRFVLSCSNPSSRMVLDLMAAAGLTVRPLYLGFFGRREVRQLVERYRLRDSDDLVDTVLGLVGHSHTSRLPFMICTLISVAAENSELVRDGNDSEVLEKFVQILLSRDVPLSADSTSLDPNERQFLLVQLAVAMYEQRSHELDRARAIDLVRQVLESLRRKESPLRVLESFEARGLLTDTFDGKLMFRQSEVLSLMLARGIISHDGVSEKLADSLIDFTSITRHRAALSRTSRTLLVQTIETVEGLTDWEVGQDLNAFLAEVADDEWSTPRPGEDESSDAVSRLENRDRAHELEQEFRDQLWDTFESILPSDPTSPKPFSELSETGKRIRLANVISSVVRGTDLVVDSALREQAIDLAIRLWSDAAASSARNVEARDSLEKSLLESGIFGEPGDKGTAELAALVARVFPLLLAHVSIRSSLGNPRLAGQLEALEATEDYQGAGSASLFLALFASEMRLSGWTRSLRRVWEQMRHLNLPGELIFRHTNMTYTHQDVTDEEAPDLARLLAEMLVYRSGDKGTGTKIDELNSRLLKGRLTSKFKKRVQSGTTET